MRNIMHEQLNLEIGSPLKVKFCDYSYFTYPWHFHPEIEIIYIIKSTGTRYVGDNIGRFDTGDLVLLGSYVPHMYRNDDDYYKNNPLKRVHAVTIQFAQTFFNFSMKSYPEFHHIRYLLEQAKAGVRFHVEATSKLGAGIIDLINLKGLERLLSSIEILHMLSQMENKRILNLEPTKASDLLINDTRLSRVLQKINKEYRNPLTLEEIASHARMHQSAFCRYFKQKTSRTLNEYISELRIGYACRLMIDNKLTISQICYECGFNNISNFNRSFKKLKKVTPSEYIEKYQVLDTQNKDFEDGYQ